MKRFALILLVALMATIVFAQQAEKSGGNVIPETIQLNNSTFSGAGTNQPAGNGSTSSFVISPDHGYGNLMIGYRFGDEKTVPKQIVLGGEAKEMFRVGSSPWLLGLSVLGQARTNGNEFCVEYADIGASVGFEAGSWYFGLTPKVNIKTPKGLKVQLDIEFAPVNDCIIYGYGLVLINGSENNKNYVVSGSRWTEGSEKYEEYAVGFGTRYQFQSGCFVSLDTGLFGTNNEFMTKVGKKTCMSWKTTIKFGGKKLAGAFSYERGSELTTDNEPVDRFVFGIQTSF